MSKGVIAIGAAAGLAVGLAGLWFLNRSAEPAPEPAPPTPVVAPPPKPEPRATPAAPTSRAAVEDFQDFGGAMAFGEEDPHGRFQLHEVDPASPIAQVGLEPGDILVAVNGHAVSKARGRELYELLKNERTFLVDIIRDGKPQQLRFERK